MGANMLTGPHFSSLRLDAVRENLARAARAAGRDPATVTLVGVTKTVPAAVVAAARDAGLADFGENYVQEATAKIAAVPRAGVAWHYIGQLQTNKTRAVAEQFDWVHTVDRLKLAERLSAQRPFHGPPLEVCLQVKLADEETKGGARPAELPALAGAVATLPRLRLRGLMCMPPPSGDPMVQRGFFATLRALRDDLNRQGLNLDVLSMGMSGDYEAAILEGATHVRIGTALFGARG
jgi:pyridoxal phosphate enzyme (YggS family)